MPMNIQELKTNKEILDYLADIKERKIESIAMDLEGEFNLHCYGEHLCLVQIYDGEKEVIIDPIKNPGLSALTELFTSRDFLKIMYDSSSDASLVHHVLGVRITSILDLRPAVALLDYEKNSLSAILEHEFQIPPTTKKKFQQYNWMRRPLSPEAVTYAMDDVRMLFKLKDRLLEKLISRNLLDLYILKNLSIQNGPMKSLDADRYKKAKGYSRLSSGRKALFKALFTAREEIARKADKPPNTVYPNHALMDLAAARNPADYPIDRSLGKGYPEHLREQLANELETVVKTHGSRK